jgi:hypothetical protein
VRSQWKGWASDQQAVGVVVRLRCRPADIYATGDGGLVRCPGGKRSENVFPAKERNHGPDQDIPAPRCVVGFSEIPVAGVEGSLGWSLVERRVGRPKQKLGAKEAGAKEAERSDCRKHAGAFEALRERRDHG